jgi:gas vesicle protein
MKITKANVDEMRETLNDIVDDIGPRIIEAAETWLEDENDADERRDARETLDNDLDELQTLVSDLNRMLS